MTQTRYALITKTSKWTNGDEHISQYCHNDLFRAKQPKTKVAANEVLVIHYLGEV